MPTVSSSVCVLVKSYVQIASQQIIPIDVYRKKSVQFCHTPPVLLLTGYLQAHPPEETPLIH
jgi:hypothetical protein